MSTNISNTYNDQAMFMGNSILNHAEDQINPSENYRNVIATPEYVVKIDDLVSSTVENYEEYVQLMHFGYEISRQTNPNVADQLYTSARVSLEDPVLIIPNGAFAPILIQKLIRGDLIQEIRIKRLANIAEMNVTVQELVFTENFFQRVVPTYDTIRLSLRAETYENIIYSYDQMGQKTGTTSVKFNARTGHLM